MKFFEEYGCFDCLCFKIAYHTILLSVILWDNSHLDDMPMRNKTSWEDDVDAGPVGAERAKINRLKKIQRVLMFLGSFAFLCIMVSFGSILAGRGKLRVSNLSHLPHDRCMANKNFNADRQADRKVPQEGNRN